MLEIRVADGVALAAINNPPVNSIGAQLRRELFEFFSAVRSDDAIRAVVLHGTGRGFSAGGDLREAGTPLADAFPGLSADVHPAIERCPVPVVAAIHGFAIGGGLETALACHYRVCSASARIRLPEVTVGLLPLSGSQRLPRLLAASRCLSMVVGAQDCTAADFRHDVIFDHLVDGPANELLPAAIAWARQVATLRPLPLVRHRPLADASWRQAFAAYTSPIHDAHQAACLALRAAYETDDFEAGMRDARRLYDALAVRRKQSS